MSRKFEQKLYQFMLKRYVNQHTPYEQIFSDYIGERAPKLSTGDNSQRNKAHMTLKNALHSLQSRGLLQSRMMPNGMDYVSERYFRVKDAIDILARN